MLLAIKEWNAFYKVSGGIHGGTGTNFGFCQSLAPGFPLPSRDQSNRPFPHRLDQKDIKFVVENVMGVRTSTRFTLTIEDELGIGEIYSISGRMWVNAGLISDVTIEGKLARDYSSAYPVMNVVTREIVTASELYARFFFRHSVAI